MEKKIRKTESAVQDEQTQQSKSTQNTAGCSAAPAFGQIRNKPLPAAENEAEFASIEKENIMHGLVFDEEIHPRTFEDWQWALMHNKVSTELQKAELKAKEECEEQGEEQDNADPCMLHTDKRRRVWEPSTDTTKAVPVRVSLRQRNYRHKQESSGSGSSMEASTTVERNWSSDDTTDSDEQVAPVAISTHEETESIATVTSQVDSFSLVNECSSSTIAQKEHNEIQYMITEDVM